MPTTNLGVVALHTPIAERHMLALTIGLRL